MSTPAQLDDTEWRPLARPALKAFGITGARLQLVRPADVLNIYVTLSDDRRFVLRMHPVDRHPIDCLHSELWLLEALHRHAELRVPRPLQTEQGERLVVVEHAGRTRWCSLFEYIQHIDPPVIGVARARAMGRALARFHVWSGSAEFPPTFKRWPHRWIIDDSIKTCLQHIKRVAQRDQRLLRLATAEVRRLYSNMDERDRMQFGLIHADPNLSNWLFTERGPALIDFEVCAFGPFAFDLARVLITLQVDGASEPVMRAAYDGYVGIRPAPTWRSSELRTQLFANLIDYVGFVFTSEYYLEDPKRAAQFDRWLAVGRQIAEQ